jgi:hypothetical protein
MSDFSFGFDVRKSLYRNLTGKKWMKSESHENVRFGAGKNLSNLIKCNDKYFALPFESRGGILAYRKISDYGKWPDKQTNNQM